MRQDTPKVSIGLAVYNGEDYLAAALDSLLAQTYEDFELLISDNCSTDATGEICRSYASRDRRITYVRQERNIGASANFNYVFEHSDCDYFKWAAADDICAPELLAQLVETLNSRKDVDWCHSRSSHIDNRSNLLDDRETLDVSYSDRGNPEISKRFEAVLLGTTGSLDSYGLFRACALRKTFLYLPYYGPEKILMAQMALRGRYAEVPETLFFARVSETGSGNLATGEAQQFFTTGTNKKPRLALGSVRFEYLRAYLKAIRTADLSAADAAKCYLVVAKWLFQISKWSGLVRRWLSGKGQGGINVQRVRKLKNKYQLQNATSGRDPS